MIAWPSSGVHVFSCESHQHLGRILGHVIETVGDTEEPIAPSRDQPHSTIQRVGEVVQEPVLDTPCAPVSITLNVNAWQATGVCVCVCVIPAIRTTGTCGPNCENLGGA